IAEFPSLRGFEKAEAISFKIPEFPSLRNSRHCEGAKQREQSHSKFRLKFRHCRIPVIAREQRRGSNLIQGLIKRLNK
ncbi:MAG: hypothetical protein SPJ69_01470, partial [Campylobacter sp.]|uniref:hypothetical protein n=1 Tax=Campylobacter sp. TaxID=205 RepID=UPI0029708163